MLGDRHDIELRLGEKDECALTPAQDRVQVEPSVRVPDMRKIVAGKTAVELRKMLGDGAGLFAPDRVDQAMDCAREVRAPLHLAQFLVL